ncbi:hypothetical protein [Burkholderia stabilis]|uniref:hypothetical protein n=1 Tax=Burkholderia stabilis TaxID=95485 RepID=UPI0013CF23E9|nr:hypothetical protein [Burkholderia stabilis]
MRTATGRYAEADLRHLRHREQAVSTTGIPTGRVFQHTPPIAANGMESAAPGTAGSAQSARSGVPSEMNANRKIAVQRISALIFRSGA